MTRRPKVSSGWWARAATASRRHPAFRVLCASLVRGKGVPADMAELGVSEQALSPARFDSKQEQKDSDHAHRSRGSPFDHQHARAGRARRLAPGRPGEGYPRRPARPSPGRCRPQGLEPADRGPAFAGRGAEDRRARQQRPLDDAVSAGHGRRHRPAWQDHHESAAFPAPACRWRLGDHARHHRAIADLRGVSA